MAPAVATSPPRRTRITPLRVLSDEALARRAAAGHGAAFATLYERYHAPLRGYCRSIVLDAEDADDAAQSALERALRALPERDAARPLRPWLYKIAHNEAISILRRRRPQVELGPATEPAVDGPEVDAERRVRLAQLVEDLRTLPDRQRGALVMRELSGLGYDEIAGALGLSPAAARRAVFDARTALHEFADGRGIECTTVRRSLSDGDRRSLRARRIRAHLRSCNDCASFQHAIRARRADLPVLAPWLGGAAAAGYLGLGAATAGGGAAIGLGGSGLTATLGNGLSWTGLPTAAKGLAVAAAVATGGTAAVEIEHAVRKAGEPAAKAQAADAGRAARDAGSALPDSERRIVLPDAARPRPAPRERGRAGDRLRTASERLRTTSIDDVVRQRRRTPAPALAAPGSERVADKVAGSPKRTADLVTSGTDVARRGAPDPEGVARDALELARRQVLDAFELAQTTAAAGTDAALQTAKTVLGRTLSSVQAMLGRVLASVGLEPPAPAPATAPTTTTSSSGLLAGILAPAEQVLGGVESLLQQLLGRP